MKKQIITTLKLYASFILLSVITYSCCKDDDFIVTGKGTLFAYDIEGSVFDPDDQITTITGEFKLRNNFEVNHTITSNFNMNLLPSAYATSCEEGYYSLLIRDTFVLSCNKDFVFDSQTVPANSNLLEIEDIKNDLYFDIYGDIRIYFRSNFINNTVFENEEYIFKIYVETKDGLQLENEITLFMNLQN